MSKKSIVILGDSTSMSIGAEKKSYPFILSEMNVWSSGTRIVNCSMPGFTSADACAFFFNNLKSFEDLQSVIIYLGNCDTMSSEVYKGKYTYYYQKKLQIQGYFGSEGAKTKLNNRLLHFEWNASYNQKIEKPVSIDDFEFNLTRVIKYCAAKNIKVLLVRPLAHKHFPAGSGKGNFVFYHYYDVDTQSADLMLIEDERFIDAVRLYEKGDYLLASDKYKEILLKSAQLSNHLEYQTLIVNNYAVCKAKLGEFDEANCLLELLLKERGIRKEIILYNLALIAKVNNDNSGYDNFLEQAYETDESMYRIREPYKKAIDKLSSQYPEVEIIDQSILFNDNDFVDHCHLLPNGQKLFAQKVYDKIINDDLNGGEKLRIVNKLFNPEYYSGNNAFFDDYFKSFSLLSETEISSHIDKIFDGVDISITSDAIVKLLEKLPDDIKYAFEYYQRHPCFFRIFDILKLKPTYSSDVGRFPEFFIDRFMIPFLNEIETNDNLSNRFSKETNILRSSEDFLRILPKKSKQWISKSLPELEDEYLKGWVEVIIGNVKSALKAHLEKGNQINNRLKSTIFWYFRETLRFGSHSRVSMRYERITLEYIAEALAVACVIDFNFGDKRKLDLEKLINLLEATVRIHEKYCTVFKPDESDNEIFKVYDKELFELSYSL